MMQRVTAELKASGIEDPALKVGSCSELHFVLESDDFCIAVKRTNLQVRIKDGALLTGAMPTFRHVAICRRGIVVTTRPNQPATCETLFGWRIFRFCWHHHYWLKEKHNQMKSCSDCGSDLMGADDIRLHLQRKKEKPT
jgi:hypothetical protein